jgi:hypothetical protein
MEMDMTDFAREAVRFEWDYYASSEVFRAQITFQQYLSINNSRWSEDEVTHWVNMTEEYRVTPHPLGADNFATVAKYLGNQIIDVGVKVRNTSLRCIMTVMMRRCMGIQP